MKSRWRRYFMNSANADGIASCSKAARIWQRRHCGRRWWIGLRLFIAPKILGGGLSAIEGSGFLKMKDSIVLDDLEVWQIGKDLLIEARVKS